MDFSFAGDFGAPKKKKQATETAAKTDATTATNKPRLGRLTSLTFE
jgi:hypothetical protein